MALKYTWYEIVRQELRFRGIFDDFLTILTTFDVVKPLLTAVKRFDPVILMLNIHDL